MIYLFAVFGFAIALICLGLLYQVVGRKRDEKRFPAPGRYVQVQGRRIHLTDTGTGPTVVLEAGIASSSLGWTALQKELSRYARVITYDRAGFGWSDKTEEPRTLQRIVREFRAMLEASGTAKPYLLVGHSFGCFIVRSFAIQHPDEVSGLVLIDPVDTRDWVPLSHIQKLRIGRGVALSRRGAILAQFGVVRFALWLLTSGNHRIPRLISRWSAGNGASVADRLTREVRKLPKEVWPLIQMHWSDQKSFRTMAEYLQRLPASAAEAQQEGWPSGIRTILLTAPGNNMEIPVDVVHRVAAHSGHWIQLDEPELVIAAVRELINSSITV